MRLGGACAPAAPRHVRGMNLRKLRLMVLPLAGLVLAGCVSATPYAPAEGSFGYGHGVAQIEQNRFRVRFRANGWTPQETVDLYLLHRAAEVTLEAGFDWFRVVARGPAAEDRSEGAGPAAPSPAGYRARAGVRFGFGYGVYGGPVYGYGYHSYPWPPYFHPYYPLYPYRPYPAYPERLPIEAHLEIQAFAGEKPQSDPDAYDARAVIRETGPRIRRPPA